MREMQAFYFVPTANLTNRNFFRIFTDVILIIGGMIVNEIGYI